MFVPLPPDQVRSIIKDQFITLEDPLDRGDLVAELAAGWKFIGPAYADVVHEAFMDYLIQEREFSTLFTEYPDRMIDREVTFLFQGVEGRAKLTDTVAAGGAWYEFGFIDGPFAGRRILCTNAYCEDNSFMYLADRTEDGMVMNKDPDRELRDREDSEWGGGYYPEWHEMMFTIDRVV